jgi:GTPase
MSDSTSVNRAIFLDEADITVVAGDGGSGCLAFRRERFIPRGGPSGGDGGDGGSIYLLADESYNTLQHLAGHHTWKADRGEHGMGKDMHGRNAPDVEIHVPPGTIVRDGEEGFILKDLDAAGARVCVAVGGKGGRGNARFKSATNQAPRTFEVGFPGERRLLHLELKLIADAGLIGKPNAGKSTLISRLSAAKPKIAAYPFTTLTPCLGIVEGSHYRRFVLADIPGLIEGAHAGHGLGDEFLRHVERTRVLVHMLDVAPLDGDPLEDYRAIRSELALYSEALANKREIIVANKMDLTDSDAGLQRLREALGEQVLAISAVTGRGLPELAERIFQVLAEDQAAEGDSEILP